MDYAANSSRDIDAAGGEPASDERASNERRSGPRKRLLIRVAKLVCSKGEFVCIVRDFSRDGVCLSLFHAMPRCNKLELEMPTGKRYPIEEVWRDGQKAGFTFSEDVDSQEFACETGTYPKRPLRLGLQFPVRANTLSQSSDAIVENLSQQGARLDSDAQYAINQNVRIEGLEVAEVFGEVRAKVRWRDETRCGVVFDDTLTLEQFAQLAARLQAPALLDDPTAT